MSPSFTPWLRWLLTAGALVVVVLIVLNWTQTSPGADPAQLIHGSAVALPATAADVAATPTALPRIAVDVIGAVQQPGVVELDPAARVAAAIAGAGGLAPDADREAINFAAHVADGAQIRVPRVGEAPPAAQAAAAAGATSGGLIDINHADAAALDGITGIGPATAQAIIEYRTSHGGFKAIDEIDEVKGIGPSLFAQIKDHITVTP